MAKKIIILFSDTGGGHRSAGEAIVEALVARHGSDAQVQMVDALKRYAPYPFNRLPQWYPALSRDRNLWQAGYRISNGERRTRSVAKLSWPYIQAVMRRLVAENPADVYVSVHPLFATPLLMALGRPRVPVITVVTDLISIHGWWCQPGVDLCVVASEPAKAAVLRHGMPPGKLRVLGLPVAARFCAPPEDKARLRAQLGWGADRPVALVAGGGEGMGPLFEMSQAIAAAGLDCELAVIAGRNQGLKQRLEAAEWHVPAHIYGFVTNMPDLMRAADVILTKAGPGTICEAFNAGLPIILYDYLPGQETGNLHYVVDNGAGLWAPTPKAVVKALRGWIGPEAQPGALAQAAANSQKLGRPEAARDIAELIWETATI